MTSINNLPIFATNPGTRTYLAGRLTGVEHLLVGTGASVIINATSSCGLRDPDDLFYERLTPPGHLSFSSLTTHRDSKVYFRSLHGQEIMKLVVSIFKVKYFLAIRIIHFKIIYSL